MALTKKEQVDEILKCGKDPSYFIKKYLYIQHPIKGRLPFALFPFQEEVIDAFLNYKHNIVLKSRQLGLSTTTAAYCLWMAMFRQDANILIMATKLEVSKNMIKKIRTAFKMLPRWMLDLLELSDPDGESVKYLKLTNGSTITATPTSEDAGRSEALSLLIVDEAAHIEDLEELWKGLYPTLSTGGRAILFSSPKGKNFFYQMWQGADTGETEPGKVGTHYKGVGKNGFHGIKLPWYVHPERDDKWFDEESKGMDAKGVAQELLASFEGSGATFFAQSDIEFLRGCSLPPIEYSGPGDKGQDFHIWKYPIPQHQYIISADVARGDAEDFSAFYVFDVSQSEVVAEYLGKIPPDRFGEWLIAVGNKYNNALVVQEKNSVGIATAIKLRDSGYANVFYDPDLVQKMMYMTPEEKRECLPGFTISPKNREKVLANVEQVIRNHQLRIYSLRFVAQMETFIWNGKRGQALKKRHDDLILAIAIGLQMFTPLAAQEGYLAQASANQGMAMAVLSGMSRGWNNNKINGKRLPWGVNPAAVRAEAEFRKEFGWLYK